MSLPSHALAPESTISGMAPSPVSWSRLLGLGWGREESEPVLWKKKQGGFCAGLYPVMWGRRSQQSLAVAR